MRYSTVVLFLMGTVMKLSAQQESQYTQYMYNTISVNPAYAGSRDVLNVTGLYRSQWVGIEGAPKTATFSVNSPWRDRVGVGFSVISDKIGPSDKSDVSFDFSYNIPVFQTYRLYFGVKATASLFNVDYTKLSIYNPNDPQESITNLFSTNIGAGIYLQSDKGYVGVSIPYMLETNHFNNDIVSAVQEKMHFYLIGGYVFDISDSIKFKPTTLVKATGGASLQVDLSGNFLFNEKLTLGLAYRWGAAVSGLAGFQITPGLMAGYAYDFDTTELGSYSSGSHEVFLRFEVLRSNNKGTGVVSPRFF